MLLKDTRSNAQPSAVLVDDWLVAGRTVTAADIAAEFEDWWAYGSQPEEPLPTLEERVAMLEDFIISGGEF